MRARAARAFVVAALLSLTGSLSWSQSLPITGVVRSSGGEVIGGAVIRVEGTLMSVRTGDDGSFQLSLPAATASLQVRRLGFHPRQIRITIDTLVGRSAVIELQPAAAAFQQVLIVGADRDGAGVELTRGSARMMPPLGEPDVLRALPFVPTVIQPADWENRFHIAGSAGDEVLLTLDGHPLQSATHASGILSAINLASLNGASLLTHSVGAGTDARLGGVFALETRDVTEPQREVVVSFLSASGTFLQPLADDRASLLLSLRRTYLDAVLPSLGRERSGDATLVPTYADVLVRLNGRIGDKWQASLLGLSAATIRDAAASAQLSDYRTDEDLLGIRLERRGPRGRIAARASQGYTRSLQRDLSSDQPAFAQSRRWLDTRIESALDLTTSTRLTAGVGASERRHISEWEFANRFNPALPDSVRESERQRLAHASLELAVAARSNWEMTFGARASLVDGRTYAAPRARVLRRIGSASVLSLDLGRRYQFDAEYSDSEAGQAERPLFLLTRPRTVDVGAVTLESERSIGSLAVQWSGSGFLRRYERRVLPGDGTGVWANADTSVANRGAGPAFGGSTSLTMRTRQGSVLQTSYTYMRAFDQRDAEGWTPADWDVPHTFSAILSAAIRPRLVLTSSWQYHSGLAITPLASRLLFPQADPSGSAGPRPVFGRRNSGRSIPFSRLDVGLRRTWTLGRAEIVGSAQVANVLGARNAGSYNLYELLFAPGQLEAALDRDGLPRIPSVGVEIRW